jgi:hypothetical protein
MYNNNFSNFGSSSFGMSAQQSQGFQRPYQPVGTVQSFYGQSAAQGNQGFGGAATGSYQMANYRGNQEGHDQGLRGDSYNPTQQQGAIYGNAGTDYTSFRYGVRGHEPGRYDNINSQFGFSQNPFPSGAGQSMMGQTGMGQSGMGQSMIGQSGMGQSMIGQSGMGQSGMGQSGMGQSMMGQSAIGQSGMGQSGFGSQAASMGQGGGTYGTEAYHMANYRGNIEGHDQGLRGDSLSPAQQGGGVYSGNTDYSSFQYGIRGRDNTGLNSVASQFGMSQSPYPGNLQGQTF